MTPFLQYGPYIALDFETSAYRGACACAIGMTRMENLEPVASYATLIRPPSSRIYFSHIHGLFWHDLKDSPPFAAIWPEIASFIKGAKYFIAHNARFDKNVLTACCKANDIPAPPLPFLCTLLGSRKALKLKRYGLNHVSEYFGIELEHHNAASDAQACGLIHAQLIKLGLTDQQMRLPSKSQAAK